MIRTALSFAIAAASGGFAAAQAPIQATHPNGEVTLVVDMEVKPGAERDFEAAFRRSTTCTRLEPGNIYFSVHKVVDAPGRYVLYEVWRSAAALESHFRRPYTVALFRTFETSLVRPVTAGGLRFIGDLQPAPRPAPIVGDPADSADCR